MGDVRHLDEADRQRDGTLPRDPKAETKPVAERVPRVWTVQEGLTDSVVRMSAVKRNELHCVTGNYKLDSIMGGLRAGYGYLFGADTSFGKSSWLLQVADVNMSLGKRVLIVSSEDAKEIYFDRLLVRRAGVSAMRQRDGFSTREELSRMYAVTEAALPEPVLIEAADWYVEDLVRHLAVVIREQRINLVGYDYVQEFKSKGHHQDERVKYKHIAKVLRGVAKAAGIPSIIFSQLTVDQNTKVPSRKNIRECRDMANASEGILIGFETEADVPLKSGTIEKGTKCIKVDKNKSGPRGMSIPMAWNSHSATFDEITREGIIRHGEPDPDDADYSDHDNGR